MATTTRKSTVNAAARPRALALAVATAFLPWYLPQTTYAQAPDPNTLPTGGQITNGAGQIHAPQGTHLQIDQYTQKMIAEFGSFSIGANASVNLSQPGASSIALFRDVGGDPSKIFGNLTANGQLFISNQNGVLFGASARVDVGALFATSLSITDQDFMAGRYHWYNEGNAGSVVNQGQIVTANGYTALVGPQVRNDGIIIARAGSVALAAGDRVSLDMIGDGLISVSVDQSAYNASVINTGSIAADGGTVLLTARSANALLDTVINNSGTIRANSLVERNGQIVLDGGDGGVVSVTGALQAQGLEAGTTGGTIKVLGNKVGLFGSAVVDASGDAGGGTVLIGGNFQGKGPEANALRTYVAAGARISADAIFEGDGGKVIVWADEVTRFYGTLTARGGRQSGNGGFAEISGKGSLVFAGKVDLSAPGGAAGTVLFDPLNITISTNADANTGGFGDQVEAFGEDVGLTSNFDVTAGTGSFAGVASGTTIELQAENDITLQTDFNLDTSTGNTGVHLTLRAGNNVDLGAGFTITSSGGNVSLTANDASATAPSGTGSILGNANIVTSGVAGGGAGSATLSTAGSSTGTISVGNITAIGGNGGTNAVGGSGGVVSLTAADGNVTTGTIQTSGGNAGAADAGGQFAGGNAGSVTLQVTGATAARAISVGTITSTGGTGSTATTVDGAGGAGGLGGSTTITATAGSGASLSAGSINTAGGIGGASLGANSGGAGGNAAVAIVNIRQAATISGSISSSGGTGGDSNGATGAAGNGGNAAAVSITSTAAAVSVAGITATGGAAGAPNGGTAGTAGTAASATIAAATNVLLNASINVGASTVSFSFGQGGAGGILTIPSTTNITAGTSSAIGGGGSDTIAVTRDADMTLTDASLAVSGTYTLALTSVEVANLTGGAADNSFTVSGWSGTGTLDGAGGTGDSIVAVNDVATIDLTNTSLARATLGTLTLANIEVATLTGGGSANTFTVSGWSGTGTLDGLLGSDTVVAINDVADFTLTNASLARTALGTLTLSGIEVANLTGGGSANTFTVSGWTGTGTLDGLLGSDTVAAVNDAATVALTDTTLDRAGTGQLALAGIERADLIGGAGTNAFTVSNWTGSAMLAGLGADDSYSITFNGTAGSVAVVDAAGAADSITVNGTAGADAFTLTNSAVSTAAETVNYTSADIETLAVNGLAGDDTFTVSALTRAATVDGGLNSDTIIATNDVANLTLTNTTLDRTGTTQLTLAGMEVANLTGGGSANTFTVSGWSGTGTLDGAGATDTMVASQDAATFTLTDTTLDRAGTGRLTLSGIEVANLTGGGGANTFALSGWAGSASITGGGGTDTLVGPNATNTWTIDGAGDGNINGTVAFIDISHVTGGTTTDTFTFTTGSLTGNIDGGTGTNSINIAAVAGANTINLQAGTVSTVLGGTFTNVTSFTGDNTADTLVGTDANTAWTISGANDGSLSTGQTFIDIPSLTGGTLDDTFTLTSGTLSGSINGAGGNDGLSGSTTYVVTGGNSGTATGVTGGFSSIENLVGTAGADTFTLAGGTLAGTVDGLAGTDTLTGDNVVNTWTITGPNSGTLTGTGGWANIENLLGGTGNDSFNGIAGSVGGTISDGGGGTTTLIGTIISGGNQTYTGAVSAGMVILNAGTASISATNAGNNFTGPLSVTGSTASIADTNALTIGANLTGGLTTTSGALTIAGTSVGSLNSTASGAVNQTGAITVTGATNINAGGNAITLTSANNFQGTVSLTGGTTQIRDTNSLTLGNVNTGALTTVNTGALNLGSGTVNGALSSTTNGGNITQTGGLGVTGTTNLQAGTGSVVLAMANDFGGVVATSGIGIILNDVNTLTPGTINAGSGSVSLSANSLGAGGTVSAGSASSFSSNTNVNGLDINLPNVPLALSGAATQWNFISTPTSIPQPNPVTVPGGNVGVTYNLASIIASVAQQQAASASSSVSATVAAVIVDEANKTFGTDSVAEDVEYGFAGEVGATPPMDHRIDESGISLPRCVQESREGMPCK